MEKKEQDWLREMVLANKFGARIREIIPRLEEGFSNEDFEVSTDWGGVFVKVCARAL